MPKAQELFEDLKTENITSEGDRHLGAVLGSTEFKEKYVSKKVSDWVDDLRALNEIARGEPQAVYSGFTRGLCH